MKTPFVLQRRSRAEAIARCVELYEEGALKYPRQRHDIPLSLYLQRNVKHAMSYYRPRKKSDPE